MKVIGTILKTACALLLVAATAVLSASYYIETEPVSAPDDTALTQQTSMVKPAATPAPEQSPTPVPTERKAFIPDIDELQEIPEISELKLDEGMFEYDLTEGELTLSWDIVEEADYYILCAYDENDIIYHQEILWPDIEEWLIPTVQQGCVVLLSYQDMGEDSADDDVIINAYVLYIEIETDEPEDTDTKPDGKDKPDATPNPTTTPAPTQNKYYIIVDKADFTFAIFTYDENGNYTKRVASFPCAIGRSSRMTPLGKFKISSKGEWKTWSDGSYSPFYTRYTSGLYIHGPIYSQKSRDTLKAYSYEQIGTAASSGCLRTTVEAARWVYYYCPAGTVVEIVDSSSAVSKKTRPPIDPAFPTWDPTDPDKPGIVATSTPSMVTNSGLSLNEGASQSLASRLAATDDSTDDAGLVFTVTTLPQKGSLSKTTFTQAEVSAGAIKYTHDGSNTVSDSFVFKVSNGVNEITGQTFSITVIPVNDDSPVITVNAGLTLDKGATGSLAGLLAATDPDSSNPDLIYTVTALPQNGSLSKTTFTQAEIDAGLVTYSNNGSDAILDSFVFKVSDGVNDTSNKTFAIAINSDDGSGGS